MQTIMHYAKGYPTMQKNIDSTMQKDIPQYSIIRRFKASKTLNNIINTKLCILFFFFSFFSLLSLLKLVRFFFSLFLIGKKKKPSLLSGSLLLKLFFFFKSQKNVINLMSAHYGPNGNMDRY